LYPSGARHVGADFEVRRNAMKAAYTVVARTLLAAGLAVVATTAVAQSKIKVGFMLPYTGTYAALGTAIENGFRL
jgi:branched-chain amino acid transport system substrate-binding protein